YPIDKPMKYNVALIQAMMQDFENQAPPSMKNIILGTGPVVDSFPVTQDQFRTYGLLLDKAYGYAQRWLLLLPEIKDYRANKVDDVRGYYWLNQEKNLETELTGWKSLSKADRDRLTPDLIGLCMNAGLTKGACQFNLTVATLRNKVDGF